MGVKPVFKSPANVTNDRDSTSVDPINSLSLNSDHKLGITEFSNEAVEVTEINKGLDKPTFLLPDSAYQDVKEFFARPRLITKLTAGTTRGSLYNSDVKDWVTDYWPLAARNRLNGVFGYRATARITLTLAATPFQQGLVTVGFQYGTTGSTSFIPCRNLFPPLSTNLPHARLNFADTTICELDIPFVYMYDFIEFANDPAGGGDGFNFVYGNLGIIQQLPYVALAASTAPRISVYVSLVDMELFGAVPVALNAVIPQSGVSTMNKESAKAKHPKPSAVLGTVSKVADTVSRVAGYTGIPMLGAAAGTVSWLTDKMSMGAKAFGYSKPIIEDSPASVPITVYGHDSHVDVPDPSHLVSPFQSNRLDVSTVTGTEVDEMALPYVLSQWNQVFVGQLTTSLTDGTFVYATRCCPTSFWFRTNNGTPGGNIALPTAASALTNCLCPSNLCYLGQMFRYFRGGLKFRFTFAKTKFHAGRVIASFVPNTEDFFGTTIGTNVVPLPEVTTGVQPFTCSAIFDLKDDTVFEFSVPYMCARPWLSTYGSFGGVSLGVLDQLRTTGETSTSISFLVEVCAADDFEFGNYVGSGYSPLIGLGANTQAVILQSGLDQLEPVKDELAEVCQFTLGEKVTSLKEIIQIPCFHLVTIISGTTQVTALPHWSYYQSLSIANPLVVTAPYLTSTSAGNLISAMYAFVSGGTTYHYFTNNVNSHVTVRQNALDGGGLAVASGNLSDPRYRVNLNVPRVYTSGSAATALHFKVPSYQKVPIITKEQAGYLDAQYAGANPAPARPSKFMNSIYLLSVTSFSSSTQNYMVGRAASDDAKCHHYIGPPPVALLQSTTTVTVDQNNGGL